MSDRDELARRAREIAEAIRNGMAVGNQDADRVDAAADALEAVQQASREPQRTTGGVADGTPDTDHIRSHYDDRFSPGDFDRWLADHDREVEARVLERLIDTGEQ